MDSTSQSKVAEETNVETTGVNVTNQNPFEKKKRKQTSKVWNDFKKITKADGSAKVVCNHCGKEFVAGKSGVTTQYNRHKNSCYARALHLRGQQQLTVNKKEDAVTVENWKWDPAKVREALAHVVLVHELPFNFVEYEAFNRFMTICCPRWEKVSRATNKKDCESVYELEKDTIKLMLKEATRVSVTTDLWKSDQNVSYMVVTAHFADVHMNLIKRILNFVSVPPPHTGIVICDALKKCFGEWGIEKKVWTITVDNASYNDVCVSNLKSDLRMISKLPLDGKFFHVRCCAHILNILVQYGLTEIDDVIYNIRESVKYIGKSVSRLHTFSEIATQLKLPHKKLILDCGTRWNATYFMLSDALVFKDVFPRYKQRDEHYVFLPSEEDWKKASIVCHFLEEFNAITNLISGTEYPTSNLFLPELVYLKNMLENAYNSPDDLLKGMVKKMKEKFDKYWGQNNVLLALASILDPRLKLNVLSFAYEHCSELESIKFENEVKDCLYALFDDYIEVYKAKVDGLRVQNRSTAVDASSFRPPIGKGQGRGFSMMSRQLRNVENFQSTKSELNLYLEDGVVFHDEENDPSFDVLKWWRDNSNKYRILSIMACDILAIPISTVASESAFSAGGRIIDPHRCSLNPETVQLLTCGADWILTSTIFESEVVEYLLD